MSFLIEYIQNNPKDFINIAFWFFTACLAYMTYLNAKKTLFNPIRSEMVKYQMRVITEFVDKHTSKGVDFESSINYRILLKLNFDADYLLYLYSTEHIFDNHEFTENDTSKILFCQENLAGLFEARTDESGKIYLDTTLTGDFKSMQQYLNTSFVKSKEETNNSLKLQRIYFTKQFHEFHTELLNLHSNPFVPDEIKKYIILVLENINKNFIMLYDILSEFIEEQKSGKYQDALDRFYTKKINHDQDLNNLRKQITLYFKVNKV